MPSFGASYKAPPGDANPFAFKIVAVRYPWAPAGASARESGYGGDEKKLLSAPSFPRRRETMDAALGARSESIAPAFAGVTKKVNSPCISLVMDKKGYVYILASQRHGTLYVGVTSDLVKRVWQHRAGETEGFTSRYGCKKLVHYEIFGDIVIAIAREKAMKKWNRAWKLRLIEENNPDWRDLWMDIANP